MKARMLEITLVLMAVVAALVSASAAAAKSNLGSPQVPHAYAGGYPPSSLYPGAAHPPVWGVLVAPTRFPWSRMPSLPEQARWDRVPPVFAPQDPNGPAEQTEFGSGPNPNAGNNSRGR
jgi:hypothetical protein